MDLYQDSSMRAVAHLGNIQKILFLSSRENQWKILTRIQTLYKEPNPYIVVYQNIFFNPSLFCLLNMNDTSDLASIVLLAVYAFIFILYLCAIYRHSRGLYPPIPQEAEKKMKYSSIYLKKKTRQKRLDRTMTALSVFGSLELLGYLPVCNHRSHFDCIKMWLSTKPTCPFCRNNIVGHL